MDRSNVYHNKIALYGLAFSRFSTINLLCRVLLWWKCAMRSDARSRWKSLPVCWCGGHRMKYETSMRFQKLTMLHWTANIKKDLFNRFIMNRGFVGRWSKLFKASSANTSKFVHRLLIQESTRRNSAENFLFTCQLNDSRIRYNE